jgi:hypothetical protein
MSTKCQHEHVEPQVCDQTLGVMCSDCGELLAVCWADDHIAEDLWNAAAIPPDAIPCKQNRADVCAICGEAFVAPPDSTRGGC